MKKIQTFLIAILCCLSAMSQKPAIIMAVAKDFESGISFYVEANDSNALIKVDFGDGILVKQHKTLKNISGVPVGTHIVKVFGDSIKALLCQSCHLTALDVTGAPALTDLECGYNQLTNLDLSRNTELDGLNCCNNLLTTLDLSQLKWLTMLDCRHNLITHLDVTQNTELYVFSCHHNKLSALDVTHNSTLNILACQYNLISSLDLSQNLALDEVFCNNNILNFSTLPRISDKWRLVTFAPQQPIDIDTALLTSVKMDLSSQLKVNGNTTSYGTTTFLKVQPDGVHCEMTNASFPDFKDANVLKTTYVKVISK